MYGSASARMRALGLGTVDGIDEYAPAAMLPLSRSAPSKSPAGGVAGETARRYRSRSRRNARVDQCHEDSCWLCQLHNVDRGLSREIADFTASMTRSGV